MSEFLDIEERITLSVRIGESLYREFKSALEGPPSAKTPRSTKEIMTDVARTLVAFANADGGELLVGVEDDGTITGVPHSKGDVDLILAATKSHVHQDTPLPPPRKASVVIDGKCIIYFSVSKGTQFIHLTSDGRCLKRIDRESVPYSAENITAIRLEDQSRTWDRETAFGATLSDLDLDLVRSVAGQIAYGISVEKCLQYLDLAEFTPDGLRLKRAALLLFAKDIRKWHSGCGVRIMTIRGKEKRSGEGFNVARDESVFDSILKLVDSSWERLSLALSQHTQLTEAARFQQSLMYPQIACREALINAIVHRNYAIEGRGIEISVFQDRLEMLSPGMLLSTISLQDLLALKGVHESRNPLIARVLREVGLVREMGEGIRRIFNVMRSSALAEPQLESSTSGFTVTLFHKSLYDPNVKLWLTNFDQYKLPEDQVAVMALGYGGKEFSTQDIIDRLGIVNIDHVRVILTPLRSLGLIERTKNDFQAMQYSKKMRCPKREVPRFRVVSSVQITSGKTPEHAVEEEPANRASEVRLFVASFPYDATKEDLFDFLQSHFDVLQLYVPSGQEYGSVNRGFAFATVEFDGTALQAAQKIDGKKFKGHAIHAREHRE